MKIDPKDLTKDIDNSKTRQKIIVLFGTRLVGGLLAVYLQVSYFCKQVLKMIRLISHVICSVLAMGVQASTTILENQRISMAGGPHCLCSKGRGRRRSVSDCRFVSVRNRFVF